MSVSLTVTLTLRCRCHWRSPWHLDVGGGCRRCHFSADVTDLLKENWPSTPHPPPSVPFRYQSWLIKEPPPPPPPTHSQLPPLVPELLNQRLPPFFWYQSWRFKENSPPTFGSKSWWIKENMFFRRRAVDGYPMSEKPLFKPFWKKKMFNSPMRKANIFLRKRRRYYFGQSRSAGKSVTTTPLHLHLPSTFPPPK